MVIKKAIATKELEMFGHVFASVGEEFEVVDVTKEFVRIKKERVTLKLDVNTFVKHFEPVTEEEVKDEPEVIYATAACLPDKVSEDMIHQMLEEAEYDISTVFDKCTVVSCQLPNGFIITESSGCVDPENYSEEIGVEICMQKIEDRLWELEGYRLQSMKYEAEILDDCLNCEDIDDCEECPFDIVYSRKNVELD